MVEVCKDSIEMEYARGTKLLKMATVCAVNSSGGVVHPALFTEARKAAEQCNANLRSPRLPRLRLSWACCHTKSEASIATQSEKWRRTSASKRARPSEMRGGGVERAR